ncbi:MAG: sigma-54-dependent Fis family transcriptional regulator [Nitrospinaceae bacterium]|jgi:two-component system response regulator PilR (NtrC family)|nr:MAG: sigma-54-dependent Fis family transcriptional regulator [Nitrospinaceae bacterium]
MSSILVVDDEKSMREFLSIMLEKEAHSVTTAATGETAVNLVHDKVFDLVITDIRMRRADGIEVLQAVKDTSPETPVVMMTAYASAETAVLAMKKGAYDYISKPFNIEDLLLVIKNALDRKKLFDENRYLKSALRDRYGYNNIIGRSPAMLKVFDLIDKVSQSNASVLISGESGTGKELVAKAIHFNGPRKNYPFISVNCGAVPETLLESELFGHEKGAFTSADAAKTGLMETAQKGTFFLDEVGETPLSVQVKLLRVLQEREFTRVGGTQSIPVDIRIVCASNRDLMKAVKSKAFREDLFYRLNVIPMRLPALRERKGDIPLLIEHFLEKCNRAHPNKPDIQGIDPEAMSLLEQYFWPGNVRELENVIERAVVLEMDRTVHVSSLPAEIVDRSEPLDDLIPSLDAENIDLEKTLDQIEKKIIRGALNQTNGIINKAAERLNLSFRSMRYRIQKHKLKNPGDLKGD